MVRREALKKLLLLLVGLCCFIFLFRYYKKAKSKKNVYNTALLQEKEAYLAALAETVIPHSDSPGASAAEVHLFIIHRLQYCTPAQEVDAFMEGLNDLEDHCHKNYGGSFLKCTVREREQALTYFEEKAFTPGTLLFKIRNKLFGRTFIDLLKSLVIWGYCTSALGAKEGLVYDDIPVKYVACTPMRPGQRSWATK